MVLKTLMKSLQIMRSNTRMIACLTFDDRRKKNISDLLLLIQNMKNNTNSHISNLIKVE